MPRITKEQIEALSYEIARSLESSRIYDGGINLLRAQKEWRKFDDFIQKRKQIKLQHLQTREALDKAENEVDRLSQDLEDLEDEEEKLKESFKSQVKVFEKKHRVTIDLEDEDDEIRIDMLPLESFSSIRRKVESAIHLMKLERKDPSSEGVEGIINWILNKKFKI